MPANEQIKESDVLAAAAKVLKKSGTDALNARTIAKEAGCSTQPIYRHFKNMGELKRKLYDYVWNIYLGYTEREVAKGKYPVYKSMGMAYISFARAEKEYYNFLFMQNYGVRKDSVKSGELTVRSAKIISEKNGISYEDALDMHVEVWVFCYGIASMAATSFMEFSEEETDKMLTDVYSGLLIKYKEQTK